jgi:preprotein translocase subunit SecF
MAIMRLQFDVVGKKKIWFLISALVILPGLFSLLLQGLNLGIDFTSGTLFHLGFAQPVTEIEVRSVLSQFGLEQSSIQSSTGNVFLIRTENMEEAKRQEVMSALKEQLGEFTIMQAQNVGPIISGELRNAAFLALAVATVLMIAYITIRFEFKFAIAGILALIHDVLVVLGVFSLFQIQIDSTFVAAILTIVGYSINDTIVIFDRIRENLKGYRKGFVGPLANVSINQVLLRCINTSVTTLLAVCAVLFFGGDTTRVFALAIFIGIVAGTYSSIFIATNIWVAWRDLDEHKRLLAAQGKGK